MGTAFPVRGSLQVLLFDLRLKGNVVPYPNEHAVRLRAPGDFSPKTFRRTKGSGKGRVHGVKIPASISVIWGKLKGKDRPDDPPIAQALRFPIKGWTNKQVKTWLKENEITPILYEPAKEVKKSVDIAEIQVEVKNLFKDISEGGQECEDILQEI